MPLLIEQETKIELRLNFKVGFRMGLPNETHSLNRRPHHGVCKANTAHELAEKKQ